MFIEGQPLPGSGNNSIGNYTAYVSPEIVVGSNGRISKHYFSGSQRVMTRLEGEADEFVVETTGDTHLDFLMSQYVNEIKSLFENLGLGGPTFENTGPDEDDCHYRGNCPSVVYYFHPDHLGSSTFISDADGLPYQFLLYLPFGETMAEQRQYTYGTPYKFNGKESDEETGLYYYGARYYDPRLSMWFGVDPLVHKMPAWSPYNYTANNPINFIDPDGRFPWPVTVRSFISANRVGLGMFRGDGRGASFTGTSRVYSSFTVDPTAGTLTNRSTNSDPTVFYGTPPMSIPYIPGSTKTPKPEMSADITGRGESTLSMSFSHEAKDPITPGFATPDLDLNATLYFREDLENGILNVIGSFTGDNFPSAEAFITDQSGTNLFLGASMETGGVHSLFGENNNLKFNILIQIMFDSNGNFTGVKQGDNIISVQDWNKQVQDSFNK